MPHPVKADWKAIEAAWTGSMATPGQISAQFGVSRSRIYKVAQMRKWTRISERMTLAAPDGEVLPPPILVDDENAARGLRILSNCLVKLEKAKHDHPREIKTIVEATAFAVAAIGRITETHAPPITGEEHEIDAEIEYELARLAARRQDRDATDVESEEQDDLDPVEGSADDGV